MGYHFCESRRLKKVHNLEASEMLRQVLMVEEESKLRISHIVLIGLENLLLIIIILYILLI